MAAKTETGTTETESEVIYEEDRKRNPDPLRIIAIRGLSGDVDDFVVGALGALKKDYGTSIKSALKAIEQLGVTDAVKRVTERLSRMGLTETQRLLVGTDGDNPTLVYPSLLLLKLSKEATGESSSEPLRSAAPGAKPGTTNSPPHADTVSDRQEKLRAKVEDTIGFADGILRELEQVKSQFHTELVRAVFEKNGISTSGARFDAVVADLDDEGAALRPSQTEDQIIGLNRKRADEGNLREVISYFKNKKEARGAERLTRDEADAMVESLRFLVGTKIDKQKYEKGEFDEYLALAYERAVQPITDGKRDPINLTRAPTTVAPWDFVVETFEGVDQQDVDKRNILAAGALDYVYELGERMGVYKISDSLVLRWATGQVDIAKQDTQTKLYRYWKLRDDRVSPEERGMLYKRVLDKGEAKVLSRMVINESFPALWHKLMTAVAKYIEDSQDARKDDAISRNPVYQATEDLQFNLTDHMTGMSHIQVTEMYHQLKDAFALLGIDEVVAQLSAGRRKNVWSVIERLAAEEFNVVPDIGAIRTMAVEGNAVFTWIANFNRRLVRDDEFETFKQAAEAWIIAAADTGADLIAPPGEKADQGSADEDVNRIEQEVGGDSKNGEAW